MNDASMYQTLEPGTLTTFEVGPEDSIEAILALVSGLRRPALLLLPAHGTAFEQCEHFLWLKQAATPHLLGLVIPPQRIEIREMASQVDIPTWFSLAEAQSSHENARPARHTGQLVWPDSSPHTPWPAPEPERIVPRAPVARRTQPKKRLPWIILALVVIVFTPFLFIPSTATSLPAANQVGSLLFASSGQLDPTSSRGLNDVVTADLQGLALPPAGTADYLWLLPDASHDEAHPILLGTLRGSAHLVYQNPDHLDILATYSRVLVTEEHTQPLTPSLDQQTWRYVGAFPAIPIPGDENHFSFLSHLRHLLAADPTVAQIGLSGGLDIWLSRNAGKVFELSSAARDEWTTGNVAALRGNMTRVLQYLDGIPFSWRDLPPNTPVLIDAKAGQLGLLQIDQNQNPPAYLPHVEIHLTGLVHAPGSTAAQRQLAMSIGHELLQATGYFQRVRADAAQVVQMSDTQISQTRGLAFLDDILTSASKAYIGVPDPTTGIEEGGIVTASNQLQNLGHVTLTTYSAGQSF